jgi:hypothetical protein
MTALELQTCAKFTDEIISGFGTTCEVDHNTTVNGQASKGTNLEAA